MEIIPIMPKESFSSDTTKIFAAAHNVVRDTVADGVRFISDYPAQAAGSRYRRTGILRRSWGFNIKSGNMRIEGTVQSNSMVAPYNRDVQGENQKPLFERRGWKNVSDLMKFMAEGFSDKVQKAVGNVLR